jgi:hypothetical protein
VTARAGAVLGAAALTAGAAVLGVPGIAAAAGSSTASPSAATSPAAVPTPPAGTRTLCQVTDPRLPEISGLVAVGHRMLVMNDGGDQLVVYVLDTSCRVVAVHTAAVDPYDPEDLAVGADGTVWFCDTGDNLERRSTVALLALRPDGRTAIYRLTYPDGPHDAEALLLPPDGTPYVITKEVLGNSGVYRPTRGLVDGGTVPMAKVAGLQFGLTGTPGGPVGRAGELMVTGGAVSTDGRWLALRTYTDAYVWPLTGSDVPHALAGKPERIALPSARQGEAISFSGDDRLLVATEGLPGAVSVVPVPAAVAPVAAGAASRATSGPAAGAGHAGVPAVTAGIIAAVTATLLVWLGGRFRRRGV